jgi:putative ABC transport system permease protein
MSIELRLFRRLVRLVFPEEFRGGYEAEMARTYRAQRRDAGERGRLSVLRLWLETLADVARTAPRQHVEGMRQDLRGAVRQIAAQPASSLAAALVLALGIGSSTAIFSVVDAALLRPVPFDAPGRLVAIREQTPQDAAPWELSYTAFQDLRRDAQSLEQVAAYMRNGVLLGGPDPRSTEAILVSGNLLDTLRVRPVAGRSFTADEDRPNGPAVAMIASSLARERFGSPDQAIGRSIPVDGRVTTVVGVLPSELRFPVRAVELWLPIGALANEPWMRDRSVHVALVVARLRPEATVATAAAELEAWMAAQQARAPRADPGHRLTVRTLADLMSAPVRPALTALGGAVLVLLIVTASGVGLLLLGRAAGRAPEAAIRLSLGATRGRLARQFFTEIGCLVAVGLFAGVAAAHALLAFLVHGLEGALPPLVVPSIDAAALAMAMLAAGGVACVCGMAPTAAALSPVKTSVIHAHRSGRRLVVFQVALSTVLVVMTALLARSLDRVLRVDLGLRTDRLLLMRVSAPPNAYQGPGEMPRLFAALADRIRRVPGVVAVTAGSPPPLDPRGQAALHTDGRSPDSAPVGTFRRVQPSYFRTLGIPLLEGREFTDEDGGGEPVVIVSRGVARRLWPDGHAVGKRLRVGPTEREPWLRVVGVVGDVRNESLEGGPDLATYEPHRQRPWNGLFVMVRTAADAGPMTATVQRALREVEPQATFSDVATMDERIAAQVAARRFFTIVVTTFAMATVLLVGLSLYGSLAYAVASRTREMGVRAALGASPSRLRRSLTREGLRPLLGGLAIGIAGGGAAAFAARALLFEVTPADTATYVATAAFFVAVGVISSWLPARRAASIDPAKALRQA